MATTKIKIYRDYLRSGCTDPHKVAAKHKVSVQAVYEAARTIRDGSAFQMNTCQANVRLECLWQSKYLPWFKAIPYDTKNEYVMDEYRMMLRAMKKDGYSNLEIARRLKKDPSTIRHHLKK